MCCGATRAKTGVLYVYLLVGPTRVKGLGVYIACGSGAHMCYRLSHIQVHVIMGPTYIKDLWDSGLNGSWGPHVSKT